MKKILSQSKYILLTLTFSIFSQISTAEDFVSSLKNGYSSTEAYELHEEWNLKNFLTVTKSGAYSYLNLSEFLPHAIIMRDGDVSNLEINLKPEIGKLTLEKDDKSPLMLEEMIMSDNSPIQGIIVLHKGKIAYEQYPGMRKNDNHVWMSNAKTIAGLLISQLEEEGKIDTEKPLSTYLKRAEGTAWENIKIIDILNMQSGLDLIENAEERAKEASGFSEFMASEMGEPNSKAVVQTHNDALFSIKALHESGKAFEYSSANTQMLGLLIEEITGKRLSDLISENIWSKSGMKGDALLGLSPQGNGIIHGLISSRLEDMARFGLLYTPSWSVIASEKIVSEQTIKKIQTKGIEENYLKGTLGPHLTEVFREQPLFNSYQWDAVFADGDIYKSGMNGQGLYVSPSKDVVIVWFATGFAEIPMEAFARKIMTSFE